MATAKKAASQAAETEVKESKSALSRVQSNVSERVSAARETVTGGLDTARGTANLTAGAAMDFGKAYYSGVNVLGRTLWGFGQEFYGEVTSHATKTMQAKNVRQVAELQAAFLQTRLETSASHGKEFIDVAREQTEAALKPVIELLDGQRAA